MTVVGEGGSSSSKSTTFINNMEWSATGRKGVSLAEVAGITDTGFSFDRAVSRLIEMQSEEYAQRAMATQQSRSSSTGSSSTSTSSRSASSKILMK